jgi:hypothetical protein
MITEAENVVLEILKRMQADMGEIKNDVGDMRLRMTATEEHLSTLVMSTAGINHRLDRFSTRVERIERRLDPTDAR